MLQQRTQRLQQKEKLPEGTCASSTHQERHTWGWETGLAWHGMAWHSCSTISAPALWLAWLQGSWKHSRVSHQAPRR